MSVVRFATTCDKCGRRSPEYSSWPMCLECLSDVCQLCYVPGSWTEDERHRALCLDCETVLVNEEADPRPGTRDWFRLNRNMALVRAQTSEAHGLEMATSAYLQHARWHNSQMRRAT